MRRNLPERTSVQTIELTSRDRAGGSRTLKARLHWKRFEGGHPRVRIRVDSPPDLRGASYLVIEKETADEMFMYLPAVQKVRRITGGMLSDQLWGTDFSYEDIKQLQGMVVDGKSERLPDAAIGSRRVYVLSVTPQLDGESSYQRIVTSVDHDTCLALKTEFYEHGEEPRKVLLADPERITRQGRLWMAREFEMSDVRDETRSWLRILEVENDTDVSDRVFGPSLLGRGR
jgi:outer membrane lipoprotein-sorting protein